jgi:hypothetical protein
MADPIIFPGGFTLKPSLTGTEKVLIDGTRQYTTTGAIAALAASAGAVTQRITSYPATIADDARFVSLDDDSEGDVTLPTLVEGHWFVIFTKYDGVLVTLRPANEAHNINGSSSELIDTTYFRERAHVVSAINFEGTLGWSMGNPEGLLTTQIIPALLGALTTIGEIDIDVTMLEGQVGDLQTSLGAQDGSTPDSAWEGILGLASAQTALSGAISAVETSLGQDDGSTPGSAWEAIVGLAGTVSAQGAAISALEAPLSSNASSSSVSWTIEKRLRNVYTTGLATFTPTTSTTDWPVGEARPLANFSTAAHGIRLNVPSGHYLNGVLNGNSGTLGAAAAAAGSPIFTILVTREDTDRWSWA